MLDPAQRSIAWSTKNLITYTSLGKFTLTINSVADIFRGALLQKPSLGCGQYLGTSETGAVIIEAQTP